LTSGCTGASQHREEIGASVYFVDNDEPLERAEHEHRIGEAREIAGIFEIEARHRAVAALGERARERRLADLPRAGQRDGRKLPEQALDGCEMAHAGDGFHDLKYQV
jgi:hypothetical protein